MKYWELKQILYENHVDIIETVHDEYGHEIHTKDVVYCFNTDWGKNHYFLSIRGYSYELLHLSR